MITDIRLTYAPQDTNGPEATEESRRLRAWLRDQCPTCHGYGRAQVGSSWITCWSCQGYGRKKERTRFPLDNAT